MSWREDLKNPGIQTRRSRDEDSPGSSLWTKCLNCGAILYRVEIERNQHICLKCDYHFVMPARRRIELLTDAGSFQEFDSDLQSADPLQFEDLKPYEQRLKASQKKSGENESAIWGTATLEGYPISLCVFVFEFMGGSMGSVAGEKIARCFDKAREEKRAAIVVSASGGARMQEGIVSLMQMAKTCAALERLKEAGLPFFSILTHPTTGGVAASFASLGDVNIAEPEALIGFAGPRVIEQTIRQKLPEGFQRAPFVQEHGQLDAIVSRKEMRAYLSRFLKLLSGNLSARKTA